MLFQASRAVTASSEIPDLLAFSEYAAPSTSLIILACIETLGANSGPSHFFPTTMPISALPR
jgi:hypothetical protein